MDKDREKRNNLVIKLMEEKGKNENQMSIQVLRKHCQPTKAFIALFFVRLFLITLSFLKCKRVSLFDYICIKMII
jgi:hypothetical protein